MPRKAIIGVMVIGIVALVTWSAASVLGPGIVGRANWTAWREDHLVIFFLSWLGAVIVISLPTLWFAGRRLERTAHAHDQSVAAARGVGRFAMRALQGDISATDKLFDLLDDTSVPVRCQAARGLALLDKREVDKELFRQVRSWQANDKLALISALKTTHDLRARRLMDLLVHDRSPIVSRRAQSSMFAVTPRTSRVDNVVASLKGSRTVQPGETVGLGQQSVGQRRSAGAKPSSGPQAGTAGEQPKKRRSVRSSLPSMAPGERAARAEARQEAARGKRVARAATAADDRPPLRAKSADVAPRPSSGKPAARPATKPSTSASRPDSGKPASRSASGKPSDVAPRPDSGKPDSGKPGPPPVGVAASPQTASRPATGKPSPRSASGRPTTSGPRPAETPRPAGAAKPPPGAPRSAGAPRPAAKPGARKPAPGAETPAVPPVAEKPASDGSAEES